ncbi:MAG: hypothetical protein K6T80_03045 [Firmicutes bacterium]|nr:hypothetical protein [Bacillota bacterium]
MSKINKAVLADIIGEYQNILDCIGKDFFQQKTICLAIAQKKSAAAAEDTKKIALQIVMSSGTSAQDTLEKNDVLRNLVHIRQSLEKIMLLISKKINRRILFSKWAVDEISELINCTQECLKQLSEFFTSNDEEMKDILIDRADQCLTQCREYYDNHKNRFFKGQCLLESSSIYEPLIAEFREIFQRIRCCVSSYEIFAQQFYTDGFLPAIISKD